MRTKIRQSVPLLRRLFAALCFCAGLAGGVASILQNNPIGGGPLIVARKAQAPVSTRRSPTESSAPLSTASDKGSGVTVSKAMVGTGSSTSASITQVGHTPTPYHQGDIILSDDSSTLVHYDSAGNVVDRIWADCGLSQPAFLPNGHMLVANRFGAGACDHYVAEFDNVGTFVRYFLGPDPATYGFTALEPDVVVADAAGNVYIGQAFFPGEPANPGLLEFDPAGNLVATFSPPGTNGFGDNGISSMDLASDQCTIFYTLGPADYIKRFNVCTNKPLPDFVSSGDGIGKATLHVRPNGDVLVVTNANTILDYDSGGTLRQTYPFPGGDATGLALDPDGKHFWVGDSTGVFNKGFPVYKFDLDTAVSQLVFYAEEFVNALAVYGLGDSDGDGLPDAWEKFGITVDSNGSVIAVGNNGNGTFIDLPAMGADPMHKDIFVHLDWMNPDPADPTFEFSPNPEAMKMVADAFAIAPEQDNPDHKVGINLHVDAGPNSIMNPVTGQTWGALSRAGTVPFAPLLDTANPPNLSNALVPYKTAHFLSAGRNAVFHYALYCKEIDIYKGGGLGYTPGTDFTVSRHNVVYPESEAATFMHELGHNLGLNHGGGDVVNFKPNYLSIMNYAFPYGVIEPTRYLRFAIDYSRAQLPTLDEFNLDESAGIGDPRTVLQLTLWNIYTNPDKPPGSNQCVANPDSYYRLFFPEAPLDWNCDGAITPGKVVADINGDGVCVSPGPSGTLFAVAQGDDQVIDAHVVSGPNRICETPSGCDPADSTNCDIQSQKVGFIQPQYLQGFYDWTALKFDGGGKIGRQSASRATATQKQLSSSQSEEETLPEELAYAEVLARLPPAIRNAPQFAPHDVVTYSPQQGLTPLTVNFDGTASTAIQGAAVVDWFWEFGDGTTGSGIKVHHTYRIGGDFFAKLTVTDGSGRVNLVPLLHRVTVAGNDSNPLANIAPYQVPGWSDKIVVSKVTGTNIDAAALTPADTVYVDWAVINDGQASVTSDFIVTLYVDGVAQQNFLVPHPLDPNFYAFIEDYSLGTLNPGQHTIRIVADSTGLIDPAGQTHNEYSKFITVTGAVPTPTPTPTPTPPPGCVPAQITSPANGTNIPSSTTFHWSAASGTSSVHLDVGTQGPGSFDILGADQGVNTSATVNNLTGTIYVRLTSYCNTGGGQFGNDFISYDYIYQAPNPTPTPTPTPGPCTAAQIASPVSGSTIQPTTTFNWNSGTGNSSYILFVGTKEPGGDDVFYNNYQGSSSSATVNYLPEGPVYVRLRSVCSGTTADADYVYNVPLKAAGAGSVDSTLHPTATTNGGQVWATLVQPDGKIIVGGAFKSFAGCARSGIARLNADGTCDQTFDPGLALSSEVAPASSPSGFANDVSAVVQVLALQPDGKILLHCANDALHHGLYRFNSDGTFDPTFNADIGGSGVQSIVVQPDGKILIAGAFLGQSNGSYTTLARLNPDGSLDLSFVPMLHGGTTPAAKVEVIALQPDGKIIVGGLSPILARLNPDGTTDSTFNAPICFGEIVALALQSDGKVVAAGGGFTFNDSCNGTQVHLARFNPDGTRDNSFTDPITSTGGIMHLAIQSDGKILFSAHSGFNTSSGFFYVARFNSNGTEDHSFNTGTGFTSFGGASVYGLAVTASGKVICTGQFDFYNGAHAESIVQVNANGSVDGSFAPNGPGSNAEVVALLQQPDGKWLVGFNGNNNGIAGDNPTTKLNGITRGGVGRLNVDFTTDTTFNTPFQIGTSLTGFARQSDGKVVVSGKFYFNGSNTDVDLLRLNTDGSIDATFTPPSYAGNGPVLIQPDGKIVVAGFVNHDEIILRLNSNGTLDTTLQDMGQSASVISMLLQGDGKVVIGGSFTFVTVSPGHTLARNNIARLNADGSADASFDPGSGVTYTANPHLVMVLQPDGKILIGGTFYQYNGIAVPDIARLNSNGSLDPSFSPANPNTERFSPAQGVGALGLQLDGRIIVGPDIAGNPTSPMSIFRLDPDGSLDQTFALRSGISGPTGNAWINVITLQADGKILVGGSFDIVNGYARMGLARLSSDASAPAFTHRLINISTRGFAQTGNNVIIGGLIISGTGSKQVVFRALGPTLSQSPFNVPNVLANPVLELHLPNGTVISNDNWQQSNDAGLIPASFQPPNVNESAMLMALPPGAYTAIMRGADNTTGNSLFEAYDADSSEITSRLVNISTRGFVQTGAGVMIAGFIVQGTDSQTVVVRGLGPTLGQAPFNVPDVLADPFLDLRDSNGNQLSTNDNWANSSYRQAIIDSGLAPPDKNEAAILIALPPGAYTAILSGVNNTTGNALVEVYAVD